MVDALRRARTMLRPTGFVLDIHPTVEAPHFEVSGVWTGDLHAADARRRHAAADAAVATVLDSKLFIVEGEEEFSFRRYADSLPELREYIDQKWSDAQVDDKTIDRTLAAFRGNQRTQLWLREQARMTKLRPLAA